MLVLLDSWTAQDERTGSSFGTCELVLVVFFRFVFARRAAATAPSSHSKETALRILVRSMHATVSRNVPFCDRLPRHKHSSWPAVQMLKQSICARGLLCKRKFTLRLEPCASLKKFHAGMCGRVLESCEAAHGPPCRPTRSGPAPTVPFAGGAPALPGTAPGAPGEVPEGCRRISTAEAGDSALESVPQCKSQFRLGTQNQKALRPSNTDSRRWPADNCDFAMFAQGSRPLF